MFVLLFFKIVVVSRLLTPAEIGAFTLVSSVIFMAQFLRVYGTWEYIVSQKELTEEKLRLCFTLVTIAGFVMTAGYLLAAQPLAVFFEAPDFAAMMWVMAPSFLVLPIGTIALAQMNKAMDFVSLSKIRIAATVVDIGVSLALVAADFGVISLAWGYTAGNVASTLCVVFLSKTPLIYRFKLRGMGEILRFGTLASAGTFLSAMGVSGPALVVGYGFTPAIVGVFSRGQTLITFMRQGLEFATRPVTMAYFAQKADQTPEQIGQSYLRITTVMAGVAWPVYLSVYFCAPTLIPFLLGDQWFDSIPIAQALATGAAVSFYAVVGISLLEGHGLVGKRLLFNFLVQGIRLLMLLAAIPYGILVFSWTLAASHLVSFVFTCLFLRAQTALRLRDVLWSLRLSLIMIAALIIAQWSLFEWVFADPFLSVAEFALFCAVTGIVWLGAISLLKHPIWEEGLRLLARLRKAAPNTGRKTQSD